MVLGAKYQRSMDIMTIVDLGKRNSNYRMGCDQDLGSLMAFKRSRGPIKYHLDLFVLFK